jgi:hypothetical protein
MEVKKLNVENKEVNAKKHSSLLSSCFVTYFGKLWLQVGLNKCLGL